MSGLGAIAAESASLALALGLVFAAFIPAWALVVWMAKSSSPPSRWLAEGRWPKVLAWLAYGLAAVALANFGWIWVYNELIGPARRTEQRVVYGVAGAQQVLWIVALAWAKKRRGGANVSPPAIVAVRPKLTPRMVLFVLLAWVALAGTFAYVKLGPLAVEPASLRDRLVLALACALIATLIVMLRKVSREARRAARDGGNSTGSK